MNAFDWAVIGAYILLLVGFGWWLARSQRTLEDYYLGGKRVRWWQSGLSTMATQLGAISFVSAPAFVAIKEGGGLKWLCYEFGVPIALILVMAVIIPILHAGRTVSIYEYLERRFDGGVRILVSLLFQIGRGLATAVSVVAGGIILSAALGMPTLAAIVLIGAITILYDVLGGIRVVIFSDVVQMLIILVGILICGLTAVSIVGWGPAWSSVDPLRLQILDISRWGLTPEGEYAFWPMVIGGIFLYASYYGCDQSQVQRELTIADVSGVRKSLMVNALGRFPMVLLYCVMGILVGAVMVQPDSIAHVGEVTGIGTEQVQRELAQNPDRMVPLFIIGFLPHGVIGFLFVAIMAALMSSLDSALNSLSAVTMRDIYQCYVKPDGNSDHYLKISKLLTVSWGVFCVAAACAFAELGKAGQTTIELINAVGSLLYGPIVAAFVLGMMTRWVSASAVKMGVVAGITTNLLVWQLTEVSWLWWNGVGFVSSVAVAALVSSLALEPPYSADDGVKHPSSWGWRLAYLACLVYFFVIVGVCHLLEGMAR
ncbi:MAG: sodium/solute symporter [Candidatus Methylomirabilales bacterium]